MEIIHHVSFNTLSSQDLLPILIDLGIKTKTTILPGEGGSVVTFDISEHDFQWRQILPLLKRFLGFKIYSDRDIFETFFSQDEIRNAEWVRLISMFEQGYPQPKGNWPFTQNSLENVCPKCGIYEQKNPLRLYKEPNLGRKSFMSLIGVGELFATSLVFSTLDKEDITGFEKWNAIIHKTKKPSEIVHQLYIPGIAEPGIVGTEKMRQVSCPVCGTIKYFPHEKGIMRINRKALKQNIDFFRTYEWFGSGVTAFREVIVSNKVANLILDHGWVGIRMKVVESV